MNSALVLAGLIPATIVVGGVTLYFAGRSRDFRKFLAGAFFVSGGIQLYLAAMNVSIPLAGTSYVQTPQIGFFRGAVGLLLAAICFYFGFVKKPRD